MQPFCHRTVPVLVMVTKKSEETDVSQHTMSLGKGQHTVHLVGAPLHRALPTLQVVTMIKAVGTDMLCDPAC